MLTDVKNRRISHMDQSQDIHSMHHASASASLNLRYCPVTIDGATYS